jgi:hypothetical protein
MAPGPEYHPLSVLKRITDDVWIVDGPVIGFGPWWMKMPFPTRATVIRLHGGNLFVHSPTQLTDGLRDEIKQVGSVKWLIGPNKLHYRWLAEWARAFLDADIYLAPGIRERARQRISFEAHELDMAQSFPWAEAIETLPIKSSYMTEYEFFHHASATLILTDLIENFEPRKCGPFMRVLTWLGGAQDPDGKSPIDMRLTYRQYRDELKEAVETMIRWNPKRIVLAHGRWYPDDGVAELRRAFRWVLDS